jgi:glutamate/tyrosine decarboxylase-like PLP-dependent enzyme
VEPVLVPCLRGVELDARAGQDLAVAINQRAFDPLAQLSQVARRFNLWMHVDASYGGFAALAPSASDLFAAMHEADSVALDPHKWLYLPADCGCVLYRDAAAARATFAHEAEYTRVLEQEADEAFAFWDYGPELSRRFRALKVWMMLKASACARSVEPIEKDLACARHFERTPGKGERRFPKCFLRSNFRFSVSAMCQRDSNESARPRK